ncbi:MAG TPA: dihydrofolate reductase family protein [Candidatus Limnocylindria bacterium]
MRQLVSYMFTSLDGYIADDDGALDWVPIDHELMDFANEHFATVAGIVFGRHIYEGFVEYWDHLDAADPATTEDEVRFAEIFAATPRIVASRTLESAEPRTTLIRNDVVGRIATLKADASADLALVAGPALRSELAAAGLVDRLLVLMVPVVLGSGIRHFADGTRGLRLQLNDTRRFAGGVMLLDYQVLPAEP